MTAPGRDSFVLLQALDRFPGGAGVLRGRLPVAVAGGEVHSAQGAQGVGVGKGLVLLFDLKRVHRGRDAAAPGAQQQQRPSVLAADAVGAAHVIVDGLPVKTLPGARNVIKGDAKSLFIAAASILAKTARDADCMRLERLYPGYGFAQHKGYPTKAHIEALARLGPCPEHRLSFGPVAAVVKTKEQT